MRRVLQDEEEQPVVRHEAGEALGNFGKEEDLVLLSSLKDSGVEEVRDTCRLAVDKVADLAQHSHLYGLQFNQTVEPALPADQQTVAALCQARGVDWE